MVRKGTRENVVLGARQEDTPRFAESVRQFRIEREIISPERTDCTFGMCGGQRRRYSISSRRYMRVSGRPFPS